MEKTFSKPVTSVVHELILQLYNKTRRMSGLTDEWLLKMSENSIKYVIDIDNFDKKIKTFRPGREIHSKNFKIGRSTFCIDIYPAGKTSDNKGSVSIFLMNRSDWRVKAKATISIRGRGLSESISEEYFQPSKGWGFGSIAPHSRCNTDDLLSYDSGMITFKVGVELLEEEVLPGRDLSKENTMERIEKLETTIQNMEKKNERQTNELKKMIHDLTLTLSNNLRPSQQKSSLDVECPVCMENVRPPMRLKQCGQVCSFNLLLVQAKNPKIFFGIIFWKGLPIPPYILCFFM